MMTLVMTFSVLMTTSYSFADPNDCNEALGCVYSADLKAGAASERIQPTREATEAMNLASQLCQNRR